MSARTLCGYTPEQMDALIAYALDCARSDVECHTAMVQHDGQVWHDLDTAVEGENSGEFIAYPVELLKRHGCMEQHPTRTNLVRFPE